MWRIKQRIFSLRQRMGLSMIVSFSWTSFSKVLQFFSCRQQTFLVKCIAKYSGGSQEFVFCTVTIIKSYFTASRCGRHGRVSQGPFVKIHTDICFKTTHVLDNEPSQVSMTAHYFWMSAFLDIFYLEVKTAGRYRGARLSWPGHSGFTSWSRLRSVH